MLILLLSAKLLTSSLEQVGSAKRPLSAGTRRQHETRSQVRGLA